jgi:hypothetical protein
VRLFGTEWDYLRGRLSPIANARKDLWRTTREKRPRVFASGDESRADPHYVRAPNLALRPIGWDGSLPENISGSAVIWAVEIGNGKDAQTGDGRSRHSPPRRKLVRRRHKE